MPNKHSKRSRPEGPNLSNLVGWRKDPYDKRDKIRPYLKAGLPDCVDLRHLMPPVRDQGLIGACVGFGLGSNLYAQALIDQAVPGEWFSPTWIYNGARFLEGTLPQDCGCFPRSALEWLTAKGALVEHLWPYNPSRLDKRTPPSELEPEAARWPVLSYQRVIGGAAGVMSALAEGKPVSIGTPWYDKWMTPGPNGLLAKIDEQDSPAGGHETCVVGYDASRVTIERYGCALFLCMNSWGAAWGDLGYFWLPAQAFEVFTRHGGYDAHTIDVCWNTTPPPPDPDPDDPVAPKPHLPTWAWVLILAGAGLAIYLVAKATGLIELLY